MIGMMRRVARRTARRTTRRNMLLGTAVLGTAAAGAYMVSRNRRNSQEQPQQVYAPPPTPVAPNPPQGEAQG